MVSGIRYFVNFISVVVLCYIMWSPKTPLRLPGKKAPVENDSEYFFGANYHPYLGEPNDQERQNESAITVENLNSSRSNIIKEC